MNVNHGRYASCSRQKGFTFLELVVVITIISILAVFAFDRYYRLLVDVERTTMEHDLGVMRSAIAMQVASYFVAGKMPELETLLGTNPMELLAEQPKNYLGVRSRQNIDGIEPGNWFYDADAKLLVYVVRNTLFFETERAKPARVRFKIFPVYSDRDQGSYLSGLRLRSLETYRWLKTNN